MAYGVASSPCQLGRPEPGDPADGRLRLATATIRDDGGVHGRLGHRSRAIRTSIPARLTTPTSIACACGRPRGLSAQGFVCTPCCTPRLCASAPSRGRAVARRDVGRRPHLGPEDANSAHSRRAATFHSNGRNGIANPEHRAPTCSRLARSPAPSRAPGPRFRRPCTAAPSGRCAAERLDPCAHGAATNAQRSGMSLPTLDDVPPWRAGISRR